MRSIASTPSESRLSERLELVERLLELAAVDAATSRRRARAEL